MPQLAEVCVNLELSESEGNWEVVLLHLTEKRVVMELVLRGGRRLRCIFE